MTDELTPQSLEVDYCETMLAQHGMTPRLQNYIEDMGKAMCHAHNCAFKMDECHHRRLAHDLMRATIDYHATLLEKKNHKPAADILRSEM